MDYVIDIGHGGGDPGAVSASGEKESDINAMQAESIAAVLRASGKSVGIAPRGSLSDRVNYANANANGAKLFISIHNNAATNPEGRGEEVWVYRQASAASNRYGASINKRVANDPTIPNRGIHSSGFYVLKNTQMPAVLLEGGFVTNNADLSALTSQNYIRAYALSVVQGIADVDGFDVINPWANNNGGITLNEIVLGEPVATIKEKDNQGNVVFKASQAVGTVQSKSGKIYLLYRYGETLVALPTNLRELLP